MVDALSDVDGSILDCKKSIEEFDNEILNLHTEVFDRIQEQFSNLDSEISNIIGLFDEFEVSDEKGIWSKEAIAQLGLLSQQYELAQYQVQQYNDELDELNKQYLAGKYSATEYADQLAELNSAQWNAVDAAEATKDSIMDLNETRVENQIKGIEKEIDAYEELTNAQIDALKASKDLHEYENSIAEKTKSITDLERQIAEMTNDTSASTTAKRKKFEQKLSDAKKDLEETEYNHSIETQEDALNKQFEQYEEERNAEIDALRESLNDREKIISDSLTTVKDNASLVGQEIATIAAEHGITVSNTLISSWQSGENAIAGYGEVLSQKTSAFIGNVKGVENEVKNLQAKANTTADSLACMFSTKADNLVNELTTSYYAESNLAYMTQSLRDSLINTLERGYDVSKITSAINSIKASADAANESVKKLGDIQTTSTTVTKNYSSGGGGGIGSKALSYTMMNYATGTRSSKGNLIVTDEKGYELKFPKLSSGKYTIANEGTQILTKAQTDNIFEWAKINPNDSLISKQISDTLMADLLKMTKIPDIVSGKSAKTLTPVTIGNLVNVQGSVDKSNIKQMETIANNAVDKLIKRINDGVTYGA
ncbi:MAG: hypothetical protein NC541_08525 [bacterium]|nr:hypothetical protein [bacterium]